MKLELSPHVFVKYTSIIFHENPSSGRDQLYHADGRKDRCDEANSRLWKFCEKV